MPRDQKSETAAFLAKYNPTWGARSYVTPEQWDELRPVVLEGIGPLAHLSENTLRPFLQALTRLALFALEHGYEMKVDAVLSPALIEAFLATVRNEAKHPAPFLWRLSKSAGLTRAGDVHAGLVRPDFRAPYSDDELTVLLLAARSQFSTQRVATLLAIIFLGAGCGVTRDAARNVSARDLHQHDDVWFVRTSKYCARVRDEFVPLLHEVGKMRPSGRLRGGAAHDNVTSMAVSWLENRRGVPTLSVDRLRATYVCALLREGIGVVDVLTWTGLRSSEALDGYLDHVLRPFSVCATSNVGAK